MSVELIVHAGTKFALEQWLDARGLGVNVQDVDPTSPTFGDYFYTHTAEGSFYYWNHPSGVVTKSVDNTDPENPIVVQYAGFYARLSFPTTASLDAPRYVDDVEIPSLSNWVSTRTAVSIVDGVNGVGGEGISILDPEDLYAQITANNAPVWGGLIGVNNDWSDPALWAFSNVMTGDQREFDGVLWESTIDFNVWTPTQYPQGWVLVDNPAPPEFFDGALEMTVGQSPNRTGFRRNQIGTIDPDNIKGFIIRRFFARDNGQIHLSLNGYDGVYTGDALIEFDVGQTELLAYQGNGNWSGFNTDLRDYLQANVGGIATFILGQPI